MSSLSATRVTTRSELTFAGCLLTFMIMGSVLTIVAPIVVSVVIVFLFAGPHNYAEAKYFLSRLPARMGRLKPFFLTSAFGVISLTIAFPLLTRIPSWLHWSPMTAVWLIGLWNSAFVLWCTALVSMRSRQAPRRDWDYAWPIGMALIGLTWLQPVVLPYLLVYAHPLMSLWILDRELQKSRPAWLRSFRLCISMLPVFAVIQWTAIGSLRFDALHVSTTIQEQIERHAGTAFFSESASHRLVATHAFLELLHYGIWLIAIPVVSGRVFSPTFDTIPLMKRSGFLKISIRTLLMALSLVVVALWLCFAADYSTTRDVYFTVATLHVLAEIPFLLRLL